MLPDNRKGENTRYEVVDAGLGAFSIFFTQYPSFLEFQRDMEKATGKSNANSLFSLRAIPKDEQIRRLLDQAKPEILYPVFEQCFEKLKQTGEIKQFQSDLGYLVALDGTQSISSTNLQCCSCLHKKDAKGKEHYYHSILTPVIVKPGGTHVLSLPPEYISNKDGASKQDCENAAAKRWVDTYGGTLCLEVTFLGDDLYAHQPFIEKVKKFHFIFVCKQESHVFLYDWLSGIPQGEREFEIRVVTKRVFNGRFHEVITCRYMNNIPLKDGRDGLLVNWCEMTIVNEKTGRQSYMNTWITDHRITNENVFILCRSGRTRWKIENENNNTLKTKGYHFEHNYGHGEKNLANFLSTLILIAFLFHTLLDLFCAPFVYLREKFSRQSFFNALKMFTLFFYCESWGDLFATMRYGLEKGIPLPKVATVPSG